MVTVEERAGLKGMADGRSLVPFPGVFSLEQLSD
jgi:hypothetical protein